MTGYGRAREMRGGRDITVEVRSVNNRYLDCTVKMPRSYIFAEDAMKARVQKAISRGKVDVFVTIDTTAADVSVVEVNEPLARSYHQALLQIRDTLGLEGEITASTIAKFPDVLTVTRREEDLDAYYKILEVSPNATDAELKSAYRKKCVEFHPDKLQSKGLPPEMLAHAENEMRRINQAYDAIYAARKKK